MRHRYVDVKSLLRMAESPVCLLMAKDFIENIAAIPNLPKI